MLGKSWSKFPSSSFQIRAADLKNAALADLYDADGSHPSRAGSYLAACTFLGALVGKSPVGAPVYPDGVTADDAARLQAAAWDAARG